MLRWVLPVTIILFVPLQAENLEDAEITFDLNELQAFQEAFDEKYFEINHDFEKLRHVLLHLVKTTGKMATYCEVKEHGKVDPNPSPLVDEVVADLLIHALQIANHFQVDLGEKYRERIEFIIHRQAKGQLGE